MMISVFVLMLTYQTGTSSVVLVYENEAACLETVKLASKVWPKNEGSTLSCEPSVMRLQGK